MPSISNKLSDEIDQVEPFIEDYYPKLDVPIKENNIEIIEKEEVKEQSKEKPKNKPQKSLYNYYPYYMYNNYYRKNTKKRSR